MKARRLELEHGFAALKAKGRRQTGSSSTLEGGSLPLGREGLRGSVVQVVAARERLGGRGVNAAQLLLHVAAIAAQRQVQATKGEGNIAYIKWTVRAVFLPGKDGKPELHDNGFWEVVSGTGTLKNLKGAGTLHIKPANPTDRIFILEGTLVPGS